MSQPIESIIIRAQKNFDVVRSLNPIQIETEDDRITNILKKYKNVIYNVTPLGLLFPASAKNDTKKNIYHLKKIKWSKKANFKSKCLCPHIYDRFR